MTLPLMALAVGAIVAGFVSIPPALGGGAVLEHFLEPSFTAQTGASARASKAHRQQAAEAAAGRRSGARGGREGEHGEPHISHVARARR